MGINNQLHRNRKNGSISYNNLEKDFLRVVTYEYEGKALEPKLMAINFHEFHPMHGVTP